jgi:hypothetical protein
MRERYLLAVTDPTVIAIDWSGARRARGIWLAVVRSGRLEESRALSTREEAIAYVTDAEAPFIAGFDFSFSVPEWFARANGCMTIDEVWALAADDGERWLTPTPPFWRARCEVPPGQRFRRCETRYPRAKSLFQLVGNGQVGAGSVRGMPLLAQLRAAGIAIWPFDRPGARTALEIYPSALRKETAETGPFTNEHERDAVCSALVMWRHRETVAALCAATDPTTRLEGDIWSPTSSP